jgi:hypothetical protein
VVERLFRREVKIPEPAGLYETIAGDSAVYVEQ